MSIEDRKAYGTELHKVSVKIPPFWIDKPEILFYQVEAQFKISGITAEETKFNYLISQLDPKFVENVWDIIRSDSQTKYTDSKTRLLNLFKESENARIQRLITGIDLDDLKPSQLLQKLRSVATSDVSENLIKALWLGKLPDSIKNILIVSKEDTDSLAIMADKICDMSPKTEIYSTSYENNSSNELLDRVKNLEQQISALCIRTGARPRTRNNNYFRNRSRSRNHKPLIFAFHQKLDKAAPTQARQLNYISQFSTDIKGENNIVGGALSRVTEVSLIDYDQVADAQTQDEELKSLQTIISLNLKEYPLPSGKYLWCDTSTSKIRPYIPQAFRKQIFHHIHALSHPGIKSTIKLMNSKFIWPSIKKDVQLWTRTCIPCQKAKINRHTKTKLYEFEVPSGRFCVVHIDLIGPLPPSRGNIYCLTCIVRFSNWMEAIPLDNISADTVARAFYSNWIARFGTPHKLITDRGTQFRSETLQTLSKICGIKLQHTTAYHPACNGKVERLHTLLEKKIRYKKNLPAYETPVPV
ncbi:Retrovirus-related Pol polyprotein from transposon 412 [Araneus ventricosus]|uniref:RNA-directed DNA polymerase n=1 Tax=Araneus ventricosus TaxID=182803 RepID=A0A4Y2F9I2_ARAVE|nr:Retrovirus-related Pol polyprotein from transposon 412 [Araneus ventricosus]